MSSISHIDGAPSDDEVWARAIAKCEKLERNLWVFALGCAAIVGFQVWFGLANPGSFVGPAIACAMSALIIRLDVQYWRVIGFAPTAPYWRRVADLAPQLVAVGVAAGGVFIVLDEALRPGAIAERLVAAGMGVGAAITFAMALGLAVRCDITKARRWLA